MFGWEKDMYIICNAYNNYDNSVFTAKICIFVNKIGTKPNCIFQKESILFIGLINYKNMKLAKKYWWLFLLVVVTPIVMNIFMIQPKFFTFVGNDSSWLGFWGSYIGAVLSSAIALFVLFRQQQQNHFENMRNRSLQIAVIKYSQELEKFRDLRTALIDFQGSFDYIEITKIAERFIDGYYDNVEYEKLKYLVRDIDDKNIKVDTILNLIPLSNSIIEFNQIYNKLYYAYCLTIDDLLSFFDLIKDIPQNESEIKIYVKRHLSTWNYVKENQYKNIAKVQYLRSLKSIGDIIIEYGEYDKIKENAPNIIKERLIETLSDTELIGKLKGVINIILLEEQKRINDILQI